MIRGEEEPLAYNFVKASSMLDIDGTPSSDFSAVVSAFMVTTPPRVSSVGEGSASVCLSKTHVLDTYSREKEYGESQVLLLGKNGDALCPGLP